MNNNLFFIDSFQFLSSSWDISVKNLCIDDFKYLRQQFDSNVLDLVLQREFYPYEYMTGFEQFEKPLPSKEKFYSFFTNNNISDKGYEHVLKVRNTFEIKTIKDYHELLLKCDVLLLADAFQKFRNSSLKNHRLCPSHCLSALALTCDAMLNMIKISLNLFQMLRCIFYLKKV